MDYYLSQLPVFLILLFAIITFLQSGFDKLFDWNGNLSWLRGHFKETFMRGMVPLLVGTIMILELLTGAFAVLGIYFLLQEDKGFALISLVLAALTLLLLLFGQRMAKDYAGAFTLTGYFIIILFGVFLLTS